MEIPDVPENMQAAENVLFPQQACPSQPAGPAEGASAAPVISLGEWMVIMLILALPLVNIVMLFVWGFGNDPNGNRVNFAKANLIWMAIGLVLYLIIFVIVMLVIAVAASRGGGGSFPDFFV